MSTAESPPSHLENVISTQNSVKVIQASSSAKGCPASNVLSKDDKQLWMSDPGIPQSIIIDLGQNF